MQSNLKDPRWRLNNFYKIVDKDARKITFKENGIQRRINSSTAKRKMILKYRQGGVTTNEVIKQLDYTIWNHNVNACILSHEQDSIEKIFNIARRAHAAMPKRIQPPLDKGGGSKYEMRFPKTGSKIYCDLQSRGDTIHWLHISEAAFADPDRMKATLEAVPINGIVTFESTPNGLGNLFHQKWINKHDTYEKLFFPWYVHDEYKIETDLKIGDLTSDEKEFIIKAKKLFDVDITLQQIAFRRFKQQDLKDLYIQEYPEDDTTCFLASGNAAMDLMLVSELIKKLNAPIKDDGTLQIYKEYDRQSAYVCGVDVAEGVRKDYSVATIFNTKTREQCAQFRSNRIKPGPFAKKVKELCALYQYGNKPWPLLAVEQNNHGHTVLHELDEYCKYPNLYSFAEDRLGWKTDSVTRPLMIDAFIDGVESGTILLNSLDTLSECLTLVDNNGKIEANDSEENACFDDCVIAASIAVQMIIEHGPSDLYNNLHSKILV